MLPNEIEDADRKIIERYITLLYAESFAKSDAKESGNTLIGKIQSVGLKAIEAEMFNTRRTMMDRKISIQNTGKGQFRALVRGSIVERQESLEMVKVRIERLQEELIKRYMNN